MVESNLPSIPADTHAIPSHLGVDHHPYSDVVYAPTTCPFPANLVSPHLVKIPVSGQRSNVPPSTVPPSTVPPSTVPPSTVPPSNVPPSNVPAANMPSVNIPVSKVPLSSGSSADSPILWSPAPLRPEAHTSARDPIPPLPTSPTQSSSPELTISSPVPSSFYLSKNRTATKLSNIIRSSSISRAHLCSPDISFRPSSLAAHYAPPTSSSLLLSGAPYTTSTSTSDSGPSSHSPTKHRFDDDTDVVDSGFRTPEKRRRNLYGGIYSVEHVSPTTVMINGRTYVAVDTDSSSSFSAPAPQPFPLSTVTTPSTFLASSPVPLSSPTAPSSSDFNFDDIDIDLPPNYMDLPGLRTPPPRSSPVRVTPLSSPARARAQPTSSARAPSSIFPLRATPSSSPVRATPSSSPVRATPSSSPVRATPSSSPVRAMPSSSPVRATPSSSPIHGFLSSPPSSIISASSSPTSVPTSRSIFPQYSTASPSKLLPTSNFTLHTSQLGLPPPLPPSHRGKATRKAAIAAALGIPSSSAHPPPQSSHLLHKPVHTSQHPHPLAPPSSPQLVYPPEDISSPAPARVPSSEPFPPSSSVFSSSQSSQPPSTYTSFPAPTHAVPPPPFLNAHLGDAGCIKLDRIDRRLAVYYQSVHNLPVVDLRPATDDPPSTDDDFLTLDHLLLGLNDDTQQSILSCLNFTYWGLFINPSRVPPYPLLKTTTATDGKSRPVVVRDDRYKAVYCTVGQVHSSYIYNPRPVLNPGATPYFVRGVGVIGLNQEVQSAIAHVGLVHCLKQFAGNASNGVIDFRSADQTDCEINPVNPNDLRPTVPIPITNDHFPISNNSKLKELPFFKDPLPFNHTIPIFDGRPSADLPAFAALPWQLSRIGQRCYPLYNNGHTDLPRGSIVSVGYTTHAFTPTVPVQGLSNYLSFNLQFLVLLALPPSVSDIPTAPTNFTYNSQFTSYYPNPSLSAVGTTHPPHDSGSSNSACYSGTNPPLSRSLPSSACDIVHYEDLYN
ncbi:hypothetical protein EV360DRAFT_90366 [Lentinula raphanica]|nr:hypothetical protein EV360DRAFT_90366 [Lentinula raphanica]